MNRKFIIMVFLILCSLTNIFSKNNHLGDKLIEATKSNNIKTIEKLIKKNVDINYKDENGKTALILAIEQNNIKIIKYLIENGADINIADDKYEKTPLMLASANGHFKIVKMLIEKGADIHKIQYVYEGYNALMWACVNGHYDIVKFLIEKGADVNKEGEGFVTSIPLMCASDPKIVKLLIENGADVNGENNRYWNVLMTASYEGNYEKVKCLIENGADVNIVMPRTPLMEENDPRTALEIALSEGHTKIADLLKANGAKEGKDL